MKNITFVGWVRNIDEKNPVRIDVNHFWVFKSPNSIPRTIVKKIETPTNINERLYARNRHHQGNVNFDCFFSFERTLSWLYK